MIKKYFYFIIILLLLFSCIPKVVKQNGKNYSIIDWEGGNFIYITYYWKGGKYDDAVSVINKLDKIKKERNLDELAIGIYPGYKEWHIGFIAKEPVKIESIDGYKLQQMIIPAGKYASFKTRGYTDYLFLYWKKFRKMLIDDGLKVDGNVFEIYKNDTYDKKIPVSQRNGELRYKINQ